MNFARRKKSTEVVLQPMTDEQLELLSGTFADIPAALQELESSHSQLVERVRAQQSGVAEVHRHARSNPELLNLRVLGRTALN